MIIDTHCHIYDEKLDGIRKNILENLDKKNQIAICCGDDIKNSKKSIMLAKENKNIFCAVGIHPENIDKTTQQDLEILEELAKEEKVVAIGEIGIDYHYDDLIKQKILNLNLDNKEKTKFLIDEEITKNHNKQKEILKAQIDLSLNLSLPCVFHVRDAMGDFLEIIEEYFSNGKIVKGVVHCFSGSLEVAKNLDKKGLFFGVNGIVTFKNSRKTVDVVKEISINKLLIETDCPYLTPEPFRNEVNRPEYVELVSKKISEIKNMDKEEVEDITFSNAKKLFNF